MIYIALIDSRRLRILREDPDGVLIEQQTTEDREAVAHERDLRADRAGRVVNAAAGARVALTPKTSSRSIALQRWLKSIGMQLLELIGSANDGIVLVASARLLGLLRVNLPVEVRRAVLAEVPRDLVKQGAVALEARLRPTLLKVRAANLHAARLRKTAGLARGD
jgi:protein required for attachment to host cells